MRSDTWPFSTRISIRESISPRKRTRMRVALLSSISDVSPAVGLTASSESALPFQLTVIEPPAEEYVLVNGAGPCGAGDVELLVLDEELDELLEDVLEAGGSVGFACPPTVAGGGATTVEPGAVERTVTGTVVVGLVGVVDVDADDSLADVRGTALIVGSADVVGLADVSVASEVDGSVAGASVSSPLPPLSNSAPAATTTISVARPATPARRRRMPRARASTAS